MTMTQRYPVIVLFVLVIASGLVSFTSYKSTEREITDDMRRALAQTLKEQKSDVISADTIQIFNQHLQMASLRGKAILTVDTRQGFQPQPQCSMATIFLLSEQRPAFILWSLALLWGLFCLWQKRHTVLLTGNYGGLIFSESDNYFYNIKGTRVKLTPMQQQLMEMFFRSSSHTLTKKEICDALWPKKDDANETLYTLIRRLKPILEQHSRLYIECNRGRAYELKTI